MTAFNQLGEATFILKVTPRVPSGVVVAEGVWWLEHCPGKGSVNALTSQRLTDRGTGAPSTTIPLTCDNLDFFSRYDRINLSISRLENAISEIPPGLPFQREEISFECFG